MPNIDFIIQHHPSRAELVKRLTCDLPSDTQLIVSDESPPSPWAGYLKCLSSVRPGFTHACILQDDTVGCRNVTPATQLIAERWPDTPVCLFLGKLPMRTRKSALIAGARGEHYVDIHLGDFLPVVAMLWPVDKAREFYAWGTSRTTLRHRNGLQFQERSDDAMGGRWMRQTRQHIIATIPSLIEHPDDVASTISKRPANRTALFWHGQDWDALSVDW